MDKWMMLTGAAALTLVSFSWLALAMQDHWEQVYGALVPSRPMQRMLRMMGASGLLASAVLCFAADRPSMAVLVWVLLMAFGAVSVALTLTWKPALLRLAFPLPASRRHTS